MERRNEIKASTVIDPVIDSNYSKDSLFTPIKAELNSSFDLKPRVNQGSQILFSPKVLLADETLNFTKTKKLEEIK